MKAISTNLHRLRKGTELADAVIYTAFNDGFTKFKQNCEAYHKVIEAIGSALAGSNRPFVVTSDKSAAKVDAKSSPREKPRAGFRCVASLDFGRGRRCDSKLGVSIRVVRNSKVYDSVKQGLVSFAVEIARKHGLGCRYAGEHLCGEYGKPGMRPEPT